MTDIPDILDFEASGFGKRSYPIEVGVCLSDQTRFCALIKPEANWTHWDRGAQAIHGISPSLLQEKGQNAEAVCMQLNTLLEGRCLYSDAWVADKAWLNRLFESAKLQPTFQLRAIEHIQTECQHLVWDRVRDRMLKESAFTRHRASSDALFIQKLFLRSREICEAEDVQLDYHSSEQGRERFSAAPHKTNSI